MTIYGGSEAGIYSNSTARRTWYGTVRTTVQSPGRVTRVVGDLVGRELETRGRRGGDSTALRHSICIRPLVEDLPSEDLLQGGVLKVESVPTSPVFVAAEEYEVRLAASVSEEL